MKSTNILIAGATLLFMTLLSGCQVSTELNEASNEVNPPAETKVNTADVSGLSAEAQAQIQLLETVKKQANLNLEFSEDGDEITLKIMVDNSGLQPIQSVQSWLSYNPQQLKGKSVEGASSSFLLTAPYNNTFDEEKGLVMIGRSHSEPLSDESLVVAEVVFERLTDDPIFLDAYDYQEDLSGHTSANIIVDEITYNVLIKPESPLLVINNK